jgi:nicotinamidase-related amidase
MESTVQHGFFLYYYVVVPTDCVAHWEKVAREASLRDTDDGYGQLITVGEVLDIRGIIG